jgi:hypothetical protein
MATHTAASSMTVHLVTFSDENMSRSRKLCSESALRHGVDEVWEDTYEDLKQTNFFQGALDNPKGCGFWSWKPLVILDTLNQAQEWDMKYLIYSDAGIEFINGVNYIIDRMDQDIFLFGNNWEHAHWCKRDVIDEVWPCAARDIPWSGSDGSEGIWENVDTAWTRFGKQCQASVIFFRVSGYSKQFLAEWLKWCLFEGGRLIDDSPSRTPNHPEFQENRHDQAILTTLAYREGIKLHYWPAVYNRGSSPEFVYEKLPEYASDDYPVLFSHHRKRNHEWENAA